jgi:hypothetical protein
MTDFFTALELAEEYGIKLWIAALLDPEPIAHGTTDPSKYIASPPPYEAEEAVNGLGRTPAADKKTDGKRSTRGSRSLRSESPTATTKSKARKIATPRKSRKGRSANSVVGDNASTAGDDVAPLTTISKDEINDEAMTNGAEVVKIEVENTTVPDANGLDVTESTKVTVEVPASHPDLELPDNMEDMLQKAREMVAEAEKISNANAESATLTSAGKNKRKAEEITAAEDDAAADETAEPVAKKARAVEVELRKERVRRRALTGIAGVLALG